MKTFRRILLLPTLLLLVLPATATVRTMPPFEGPPQASIEGTVTSVNVPFVGGGPIVTLLDGLVHFDATGATVRFSNGSAGTTADLAIGQRLVAFVEPTQAMPKARSIVVLAQRTDVTFTGTIERVDLNARTLTVLGLTARVTDGTAFGGPRDGTGQVGLENLQVGDLVLVAAGAEAEALVAARVMKLAPSANPVSLIHGVVEAIGSESWTIVLRDGTKSVVKVDTETKVVGGPKVGDVVDIVGRTLSDGSVLALVIASFVPPPTVPTERYQGVVKTTGATSWTFGPKAGEGPDRLFAVNAKTRILGDPKVGDEVDVLAQAQADGSFLAIVIARTVPPPDVSTRVTFEGVLVSMTADGTAGVATWRVGETKVIVSRMTVVVGNPRVDDRVRVEGLTLRDGSVMAARVTKL